MLLSSNPCFVHTCQTTALVFFVVPAYRIRRRVFFLLMKKKAQKSVTQERSPEKKKNHFSKQISRCQGYHRMRSCKSNPGHKIFNRIE